MPLPNPKKNEKQGDFISRCAGLGIIATTQAQNGKLDTGLAKVGN